MALKIAGMTAPRLRMNAPSTGKTDRPASLPKGRARREAMVAVAASLVDQGGAAAVTLRDVGRLTGVSHNAPYRHFSSKDDLLDAVAAREIKQLVSNAKESGGAQGLTARALMLEYMRWALANPARFRLVSGPWFTVSEARLAAAAEWRRLVIEAVARGQAAGEMPAGDPERLSSLLLALSHGAMHLALQGRLAARGEGFADAEQLLEDFFGHLALARRADVQ